MVVLDRLLVCVSLVGLSTDTGYLYNHEGRNGDNDLQCYVRAEL